MIDLRIWEFQHPLRQFRNLKLPLIMKLEEKKLTIDRLVRVQNPCSECVD